MTREIANVTATFDGELVEEEDDVSKVALCSLVGAGDCGSTSTVTVHEIHDEDEFEDVRRRYSNEFEEVVTMDVDGEDKDDDPDEDGDEKNITELVDEPTLINAADDISIDQWTKYGHDRLYINGGRIDLYIDLEDGNLGDNGGAKTSIEFDGDVVTVTMGEEGKSNYRYDEVVISLSGDIDQNSNDGEAGDKEEKAHAEPTDEHVAEVGHSKAAGQAQQAESQRAATDGGEIETEQKERSEDAEEEKEDDSEHMFASDDSECRNANCSESPDMAAECDTGQTKYYCEDHAGGRRAGNARVENWREI